MTITQIKKQIKEMVKYSEEVSITVTTEFENEMYDVNINIAFDGDFECITVKSFEEKDGKKARQLRTKTQMDIKTWGL